MILNRSFQTLGVVILAVFFIVAINRARYGVSNTQAIEATVTIKERVTKTIGADDITIREIGNKSRDPSPVSDHNFASYALLTRTIRQVFPEVAVAAGSVVGGTNSRHYSAIAENSFRFIPIRLGKDDQKRLHGIDERISTANYAEMIQFYAQLILNSAGEIIGGNPPVRHRHWTVCCRFRSNKTNTHVVTIRELFFANLSLCAN